LFAIGSRPFHTEPPQLRAIDFEGANIHEDLLRGGRRPAKLVDLMLQSIAIGNLLLQQRMIRGLVSCSITMWLRLLLWWR
jgi:hypothetical protein